MAGQSTESLGEGKTKLVDEHQSNSVGHSDGVTFANDKQEDNRERVLVWDRVDPKVKGYLDEEHKLFLAEVKQINCETSKCLDMSENLIGRSGCHFCDNRHRIAVTIPIHADMKIKKHVRFVLSTAITPAHFEYSRMFNGSFDHLPSGEFETRSRCEKLYQKLNRFGDACARESF